MIQVMMPPQKGSNQPTPRFLLFKFWLLQIKMIM